MIRYLLPITLMPLLASCVAPSTPPPAAPPPPVTRPAPAPPPAPAPVADRYRGDWSVDPLTPGEWVINREHSVAVAMFVDDRDQTIASVVCNHRQMYIARIGLGSASRAVLRIRTSAGERELPAEREVPQSLGASIAPTDPLFDQILYSRGRFVIEATGQTPLILPTRPALQRVVEECRG